ncbi:BrnT family toxin [bacterium]|nr:MAG: BrnT family toxin [bacterium]
MEVHWDPHKAQRNLKKHRVSFADAATVLDDPLALTVEDKRNDEPRWVTIGQDLRGRLLVVVYSYPENLVDSVNLISAREAEPRERRQYENDD